jgi:RimJ/RimL family protein N-acetyltransferase
MSDITLRTLEPNEWQLLRKMRLRAVTMHPDLFYDSATGASMYDRSHWQRLLTGEGNKFWGLFDDDKCVGLTGIVTCAADKSGQTAMIGYSFIEPLYRGKGFGDLFYSTRIEHALRYQRWKKLITDHRVGNEPSRRAIMKHGFVFLEEAMIDWPDGSRDLEYRYELDLERLRFGDQRISTG